VKVHSLFSYQKRIFPLTRVTPGITALEYAQRRTKLAAQLPANAIAVIASSDIDFRTGHVFYDFHQDPDFFYLTGVSDNG
jgi:intermediate cleaving peptidase 55